MSISVKKVKKNYQFGVGRARKTEDLTAFGWKPMTIGRYGKDHEFDVAARRLVRYGNDPIITDMESRYFAEYEYLETYIQRRYLIGAVLAAIFGIPSLIISILYLFTGVSETIAERMFSMDVSIKTFLRFGGTENNKTPTEFLNDAAAGGMTLALRFVLLVVGLFCLVFFIFITVRYFDKMSDPLKYYSQSAARIRDCLNRSRERISFLKSEEKLLAIQNLPKPNVQYCSPMITTGVTYNSHSVPVSLNLGENRIYGAVRVPCGITVDKPMQSGSLNSDNDGGALKNE